MVSPVNRRARKRRALMNSSLFSLSLAAGIALAAGRAESAPQEKPIDSGQRVFLAGHSFHRAVAGQLSEICALAGIKGHQAAGSLVVGNSRVIQVWDVADAKNTAKAALATGTIDVLTLSPHREHPDPGIDKFVELALTHNPRVRVTVQQSWLAYDNERALPSNPPVDRDSMTGDRLSKIHEKYYSEFEEQLAAINKQHGRSVVLCVPMGRAVTALRERVRLGQVPGIVKQTDLFSDGMGHPGPVLELLNGYCHYAVIYRRSPIGLPAPKALARVGGKDRDALNRVLQETAWTTVTSHLQSEVKAP